MDFDKLFNTESWIEAFTTEERQFGKHNFKIKWLEQLKQAFIDYGPEQSFYLENTKDATIRMLGVIAPVINQAIRRFVYGIRNVQID